MLRALFRWLVWLTLAGIILGALATFAIYKHLEPTLPDVETLRTVQLQTPLRIYSADGKLIGEFGEKRRTPVDYDVIPPTFVKAFYAAEDANFETHHGIDVKGLLRAFVQLAKTGHIQGGGSTITMQVARNFFLTRQQTFTRKFSEILLSLQMEQELSKDEIFELYVNKIYLGNRAYGIEAAAQVYYGKSISDLSLAEMAMIAGLPKAPSAYNPIANPDRAMERRNWILGRMLDLGYIDDVAYEQAIKEPNTARYHGLQPELDAPYVAEMARAELLDKFPDLYEGGYRVFTTVDSHLQETAQQALANALLEYETRHGFRGPEQHWDLSSLDSATLQKQLKAIPSYSGLMPAVVTQVQDKQIQVRLADDSEVTVDWSGLKWARKNINVNSLGPVPKQAADIVTVGDVVRVRQQQAFADNAEDNPEGEVIWTLSQLPVVQGALVSLNPKDGAIMALSGGFNFYYSNFNRATQARRQPGSNIKPFIYAAALENGFSPGSIINDAPIVYSDPSLASGAWRPENSGGKFYGPTRMREALYMSRNLVSIRLLRAIGIETGIDYLSRFGFDPANLPRGLSLALGTASLTPMEVATGYASIANGGYKVSSYLINRVENVDGKVLVENTATEACPSCIISNQAVTPDGHPVAKQIMDPRVNYLLTDMLMDVIRRGTGHRAAALKRSDLAGKTGTTNDQVDAWFSGYNSRIATSVWVGFDQPSTLGRREFGAVAALPAWMDYMAVALKGMPEEPRQQPDGIVSVRIDPKTGERAAPGSDGIFELFQSELAPPELHLNAQGQVQKEIRPEDLF
ncbi:penicillin-binding protein 1A [Pokkaliibacter plantistimulans]|uniref:penicillin-binding protein 1A n=1 Tax=Pokkaliibacter plantistimulans TaxID=1635171 RepID=UPI000D750998|nr:penicillin-binding protein 1A [Pokkaliibacter plantistimulans]